MANLNARRKPGDGDGAATAADFVIPQRTALRSGWLRVRELAKCVENGAATASNSLLLIVEAMIDVVDGEDSLLGFVAMQSLRDVMFDGNHSEDMSRQLVRLVISHRPRCATASRFQLVRQLIKPQKSISVTERSSSSSDSSDGDSSADESDGECKRGALHEWFLDDMLRNVADLRTIVVGTIVQLHDDRRYCTINEAIGCLGDVVKRTSSKRVCLTEASSLAQVRGLVECVVHHASQWKFHGESAAPTFLACSVIDLLMDSQELFDLIANKNGWLSVVLELITPTRSITVLALGLLVQDESRDAADAMCVESFVATTSSYPLLQKWILLCCMAATELLKNPTTLAEDHTTTSGCWMSFITSLPARSRLLQVLTEQDDVMIAVVLQMLYISSRVQDEDVGAFVPERLSRYIAQELDPHLVFADLVGVFGDDHLVVLDMLMSSETQMLEYLSKYLRVAGVSWLRARASWQSIGRTNAIMAVLIRLRLEMERLVAGGVFPYNPRVLLQRLVALEDVYEA